jgi:hypothetical protein
MNKSPDLKEAGASYQTVITLVDKYNEMETEKIKILRCILKQCQTTS